MARRGTQWLRNRIVAHLNQWPLDVLVFGGDKFFSDNKYSKWFFHRRLIFGVGQGGKAILLYPVARRTRMLPLAICKLLSEFESRGAVVGCVYNISDAWDVCVQNPREYKRKKRTYDYRLTIERHRRAYRDGKEDLSEE